MTFETCDEERAGVLPKVPSDLKCVVGFISACLAVFFSIPYFLGTPIRELNWPGVTARQVDSEPFRFFWIRPQELKTAVRFRMPDGSVVSSDEMTVDNFTKFRASYFNFRQYQEGVHDHRWWATVHYRSGGMSIYFVDDHVSQLELGVDNSISRFDIASDSDLAPAILYENEPIGLPLTERDLIRIFGPWQCDGSYRDWFVAERPRMKCPLGQ